MFSETLISVFALAAFAMAAPWPRQATAGVYMCPKPGFQKGDDGTACRWVATNPGVCQHLHWFGMPADAERHISFSPDKGNHCTIFQDFTCGNNAGSLYQTDAPGIDDVFAISSAQGLSVKSQYLSYMCSLVSLDESTNQAVTLVQP
jgi:hypothetical protein